MIGHTEWTVPVDDEGHFPSSSSITDRFPPPGLQNSRVTWCRNVLTFNFQLYTFNFQPLKMGAWRNRRDDDVNLPFLLTLSPISVLERWHKNFIHSQTVMLAWVFPNHNHRSDVVKVQNPKCKVVNVKSTAIPSLSAQPPTQATPRPDSPLYQRKVIFVFKISILTNRHWQNNNIRRGKA